MTYDIDYSIHLILTISSPNSNYYILSHLIFIIKKDLRYSANFSKDCWICSYRLDFTIECHHNHWTALKKPYSKNIDKHKLIYI